MAKDFLSDFSHEVSGLYDRVADLDDSLSERLGKVLLTRGDQLGPETRQRVTQVVNASTGLREAARELLDHLAWDDTK